MTEQKKNERGNEEYLICDYTSILYCKNNKTIYPKHTKCIFLNLTDLYLKSYKIEYEKNYFVFVKNEIVLLDHLSISDKLYKKFYQTSFNNSIQDIWSAIEIILFVNSYKENKFVYWTQNKNTYNMLTHPDFLKMIKKFKISVDNIDCIIYG
jgi:hypothetical protein